MRSRYIGSALLWICLMMTLAVGCKHGDRHRGELRPPRGAPDWEARFSPAYNDGLSTAQVRLTGRAPNDVLDQRLFAARLGHADIVTLVRVEQVFGKGRNQGKHQQYVEVKLGNLLLGNLDRDTNERQLIRILGGDDVSANARGKIMIMFLRWAPGENPAYHHHLTPATPDNVALIRAMVAHARSAGAMTDRGNAAPGKGKRGKRARKKKGGEGGPAFEGDLQRELELESP